MIAIAIACIAIGLTAFGFLAAPGDMGPPMFSGPPYLLGLPADVVLAAIGIVGPVVGLVWMIRIHRADPEPDQHAWRYRRDRASWIVGRSILSMTPGQRGRWIGRGLIAIAMLAIALAVVWSIAAPGFSSGLSTGMRFGPVPVDAFLLLAGMTGILGGLVWMIRIHRADPEPDQHAWRYRSRGR
jgi:hypothetical protein